MGFELEAWHLLFVPLAFAAGWFASAWERRSGGGAHGAVPESVFRGLNHLLGEQPDQAIDAFLEVARLDPEMIELHHALGNLFRRRGEIDRAVRIHTHLLNRADLPGRERANALAELGQDFLKGGLLDRAEESFLRLQDDPRHRFDALRALLRIYQAERDWTRSIETARRLEAEAGESHHAAIAQFHCELAVQALARNDLADAAARIDAAQSAQHDCARAALLAADLAMRRNDPGEAIEQWLRLDTVAPQYLPLFAEPLTAALDAAGRRKEALHLVRAALADRPSIDLLDVAYRRVLEWEDPVAAEHLLREELRRNPSLLGFDKLLALRSAASRGDPELDQLRQLLQGQARKLARYRCTHCGFRAREYHWHCPGCNRWDSYPPRRVEELDNG